MFAIYILIFGLKCSTSIASTDAKEDIAVTDEHLRKLTEDLSKVVEHYDTFMVYYKEYLIDQQTKKDAAKRKESGMDDYNVENLKPSVVKIKAMVDELKKDLLSKKEALEKLKMKKQKIVQVGEERIKDNNNDYTIKEEDTDDDGYVDVMDVLNGYEDLI